MLIKDLSKVKDEEITLQDVKRAEEIIARANKLLGRPQHTCTHHWSGWSYYPQYWTSGNGLATTTANGNYTITGGSTTDASNAINLNTSVVKALKNLNTLEQKL